MKILLLQKFKTLPIHIKVPPIKRTCQDNLKYTNLTRARLNPATKNASEIPKTQLSVMPANVRGDSENAFTYLTL